MKHTLSITFILTALFLLSQVIGLLIISAYVDKETTAATGELSWKKLPLSIERPPLEERTSFIYIILAILIGTGILLLLIRWQKVSLWKWWFFFSVLLALTVAFAAFLPAAIAFPLGILLAAYKVFRPNLYIHNLTEMFIYGGIAAIFTPVLGIFSASLLLLLISLYDAYAVWKSKHMIALAKFQAAQKVFAGLFIPYGKSAVASAPSPRKEIRMQGRHTHQKTAILGGGDIAFPLLFAGAVMKTTPFWPTLLIPLTVTGALLLLFLKSEKGKFYPAMPFLSAGCFVGYGIILLL